MNDIDYYMAFRCLETLVLRKKITKRVAKKILKQYEEELNPTVIYKFK